MGKVDQAYTFNKKAIAVAIGAMFGIASGSAMAVCTGTYSSAGAQGVSSCAQQVFAAGSDATTTVSITAGANLGGTITNTTGTAGVGSVTFLGNSNVTGNVGAASPGNLKAITAGAGFVQFSGANQVFADAVTLNGTNLLYFTHGLSGATLNFNGNDGTVLMGIGDVSLTTLTAGGGAVGTGAGTLLFSSNSIVSGVVGSATNQLKSLGINGVVTFSNASQAVYAVTTNGSGTATFAGGLAGTTVIADSGLTAKIGAGKNLAAAVTTATNNRGTLEFLGATTVANQFGSSASLGLAQVKFDTGTVSIGDNIYTTNAANSILIGNGATATYTASKAFSGRMTLGATGVLDLGTYTLSGATTNNKSDLVTVAGSTIKTTLISDAANSSGKMTVDGTNTVIATGTNVVVNAPSNLTITDGRQFKIVGATSGSGVGTVTITDNSAVLNFTQVADTTNLIIQANRAAGGYVASAGLTTSSTAYASSTVLDTVAAAGTATGDMLTVINTLNAYDATQLNAALRKAAPVANSSVWLPVFETVSASVGLSENRLASLRGDTSLAASGTTTGLAAGDAAKDSAFWLKGLGNWGSQGAKDGFDGYKTRTYGIGLGADTRLPSDWTVGLGFTYGNTDIDQQDFRTGDSTKIRSGQLTGYAGREFGASYLDVMLSYANLQFDTSRATALARKATGSFGGDAWTAKVGGGYRIGLGGASTLIPMASLQTTILTQKAYTETGAGALNMSVNGTTTTRTQSSLGARLVNDSRTATGGDLKLEGRLAWLHDFNDNRIDSTGTFTGGGASFTTNGQKIAQDGWNLGGGATYAYAKGTTASLQYDHEGRSGYSSDSVQIVGRWAF